MKKYEIMAIISNSLKSAEAKSYVAEGINKRITSLGGKVVFEDFWGEKGFAYKIKGEKWGYYNVAQFELDAEKTLELRRELNIDPKVVRFLITNVEDDMPAPKTQSEMEKEHAAREKEKEIEAAADSAKAVKPAPKAAPKKETPKEEVKEAPKKELKKDDVDKKLDQIIEDSTADL